MKKLSLGLLLTLTLLLSACNTVEPSSRVQAFNELKVNYFRVSWSEDQYPDYLHISDYQALQDYLDTLQGDWYKEQVFEYFSEGFDESYFDYGQLIVVSIEEGSGSNRHIVRSFNVVDNELVIEIERQVPDIGTSDMALWHVIIEFDKRNIEFEEVKIVIE